MPRIILLTQERTNFGSFEFDYYVSQLTLYRKPKFPNLEEEMIPWLEDCREKGIVISDAAIKDKAASINQAGTVAGPDFKASGGWLENFKRRQGIKGGQYRGTQTVEMANGHVHEEPVVAMKESFDPRFPNKYRPFDPRVASGKYPPPDPKFWEQEHDDPGLDTSMDSDDGRATGYYSSPSTTASRSFPPSPGTLSTRFTRNSSSPSPAPSPGSSHLESLEPPHLAPPPIQTPWMDGEAGQVHVASGLYRAPGEKPGQTPLVHDPSSGISAPPPYDPNSPYGPDGTIRSSPITTLEAKEQLANVLMYLDIHGQARKLCKRSQRMAVGEIFANVLHYTEQRNAQGLEPN